MRKSFFTRQILPILTVLMLLTSGDASSQVFFSTRSDYLLKKNEGQNLHSVFRSDFPDTTITGLHNYFPRNFLGNTGLPSPSYFLDYGSSDLGFRFYGVPSRIDRFYEDDVVYYRSRGPFASLTGIAGAKELQAFKALFTHTYQNRLNFTLGFRRYTSKGFYRRQQTYTNNFFLSSNFQTAGDKFGYYFYFLNNSNKNSENGGISDGELTDSTMGERKELLPVRISAASRDNRQNIAMFNPYIKLTRSADSNFRFIPYLQLKSKYTGNMYRYEDEGIRSDGFYRYVYLDTAVTNDSSHVRQFSNELVFSFRERERGTAMNAGYRYERSALWQHYDSLVTNHLAVAGFVTRLVSGDSVQRSLELKANAQYVAAGSNSGDFRLEGNLSFSGVFKGRLSADVLYESRRPDYIYNYWVSNHFLWQNNDFSPQKMLQLHGGWQFHKMFAASVLYQNISNYLYFNEDALPAQSAGIVTNVAFRFNFSKVFFSHLGVDLQYVIQNTSNSQVVRLPPQYLRPMLYYQGFLFHNHLQLQIGAEANLYEAFTPYSYMPATQVFYLQNGFRTEQYPYADVFFNVRIRPVSVFFKMENALQGFAGPRYSFVPGYYQPDRAFRFGLNWMFFD